MATFYPYKPVDLNTITTVNFRAKQSIDINCTPEKIMAALSGDSIWTEWVGPLTKVEWQGEKPYGQGSRRTVHLKGGQTVKEYFFHWQENKRIAFYVEEGTLEGVEVFAEDYQITEISSQQTRLTWTIGLQLGGFAGVIAPINAFFAKIAMKQWLKKLKKIIENTPNNSH